MNEKKNRAFSPKKYLFVFCVSAAFAVLSAPLVSAADWPAYRNDRERSGATTETLPQKLSEKWSFETANPPLPAWPGPARRDGWHKVDNLKPRLIFDWAYHVVVANDCMYFGSSSDDKVYCVDAKTGKERWSFFTDGPIRFAPTFYNGKLYVGSDDGWVYCLNAADGSLVWKYRPLEEEYRLPGNNRIISLWPIRSGVLVDGGVVYCCAGIFPAETVYLCAVDAETGKEIWKQENKQLPPQGYLLASPTRLYVPTGRGVPAVFDRTDGKYIHSLDGSGGAFALLSGDTLFYGPGKTGQLDAFNKEGQDHLATFQGNTMIVTPTRSFLHTDAEMSAIDRVRHTKLMEERSALSKEEDKLRKVLKQLGRDVDSEQGKKARTELEKIRSRMGEIAKAASECLLWKKPCKYPYSMILAGDVLYAGGAGSVAAFDAQTGDISWSSDVSGRALELAASNGRLFVSTDKGVIHCFSK